MLYHKLLNKQVPVNRRQNSATVSYLHEIEAIPESIRDEYLQKLLARKHSYFQKNVRLLKIIYHHISENKIYEWDSKKICKTLELKSYSQLDSHKFLLLKGLREYYFKWNETKPTITCAPDCAGDKNTGLKLSTARKMVEIGMRREAKRVYLSLEKNFTQNKSFHKNYLILSEIYENILEYYFYQRNLPKYNIYYSRLTELHLSNLPQNNKSCIDDSIVFIRYYMAAANRHFFHYFNDESINNTISNLKIALTHANKIKNIGYRLLILFRLGTALLNFKNLELSDKYFKRGYKLAFESGLKHEAQAFNAYLIYTRSAQGKKTPVKYLQALKKSYELVKRTWPHSRWAGSVFNIYSHFLNYFSFKEESMKIRLEHFNHLILYPKTSIAIWEKYSIDSDTNNIYSWKLVFDNISGNYFPLLNDIDYTRVSKIEKMTNDIFNRFNKLCSVDFKIELYTMKLWTEFIKGIRDNYDTAELFTEKIKWIVKTRSMANFTGSAFRIMQLGITMFKEVSQTERIPKHINKFSEICKELTTKPSDDILRDYVLLCFIAKELNSNQIWEQVIKLYSWMEKSYPVIAKSMIKQIEQRTNVKFNMTASEVA